MKMADYGNDVYLYSVRYFDTVAELPRVIGLK